MFKSHCIHIARLDNKITFYAECIQEYLSNRYLPFENDFVLLSFLNAMIFNSFSPLLLVESTFVLWQSFFQEKVTIQIKYSRLSLSRSRRDPLKHFELSVLRHIRLAELRKIPIEKLNFTKEHVI